MKYVCLGIHRTATSSVATAFRFLELKSVHYLRKDEYSYVDHLITENDAFADFPFCCLYDHIYRTYREDAQFVLTYRDPLKWLKSYEYHEKIRRRCLPNDQGIIDFYGFDPALDFDHERIVARYMQHNLRVMKYFKGKSNFKVLNVDTTINWYRFKRAFNIEMSPPIHQEFPHHHVTEEEAYEVADL